MTIAELFVSIGVKGAPAAVKNLQGIHGGLKDIASTSLAAKAAIAGVIIGLERLTGFASQIGLDLQKFGVVTGLSTQELQKWQHAAMLFDVSGNEMADTIKGVQSAMTNMKLGKGAPEGFAAMMDMVHLDESKIDDTFYVLSKIQEFIKKAPAAEGRTLAAGVGISDNMFQALKMMNLARDQGTKFDMVSPDEIKNLALINRQWKEIWHTIKMIGVHFIAKDGLFATSQLKGAIHLLSDLVIGLQELMKLYPVLQTIAIAAGIAIAASFAPMTTAVAGLVYILGEIQKYRESGSQPTSFNNRETTWGDKIMQGADDMFSKAGGFVSGLFNPQEPAYAGHAIPVPARADAGGSGAINITNNVTTHGVNDAKGVGREVGKASDTAARQMAAQKRPR